MMPGRMAGLVFAAACLTAIATMPAHAQTGGAPGAPPGSSGQSAAARQNVVQSQKYDQALAKNRGFRQARMHKECGPISDPQLRESCLASFK
jgi:hypothetical protein